MKKILVRNLTVIGLAGTLALTAVWAQGPGVGRGAGQGRGNRDGACVGIGRGAAMAGGWWTRVTPNTPEQKAFVEKVTAIHNSIRQLNQDIAVLRNSNGAPAAIAEKQQRVAALQQELQRVTATNQALLREMGIPQGRGVCDGNGPKGRGQGGGMGQGRGGICPLTGQPGPGVPR